MFLEHGWDAILVTHKEGDFPYLLTDVNGLKLEFLGKLRWLFFLDFSVIIYLFSHSKKIEVLNLYHLTKQSLLYGIIYKALNKKGLIYLKMDVYNDRLSLGSKYSKVRWKNNWFKVLEKIFLKRTSLISIENPEGLKIFRRRYSIADEKSFLLPNGVDNYVIERIKKKSFEEKENIILTVGRIGHEEKKHQILLKAIEQIDLKGWKVVFVGPIEKSFQTEINQFFKANKALREQVLFTGPCYNRQELYEYYNRSKIFCLTSRAESFGIAFVEALFFGNFLIGNENMYAFDLITHNGQFGERIKEGSSTCLAGLLERLILNEEKIGVKYEASVEYARINFCWKTLTKVLNDRLSNCK